MNEIGYYLGIFKRIWDIVSFPICLFLLVIYVVTHKPQSTIYTIAPVVAVNPDGSTVLLLSDNSSESYKTVAIHVADRVAKIIFGYSNAGQYAASAAAVSRLFEENSGASRFFRDIVEKNLVEARGGTAIFTIDSKKTIAELDPQNSGIMVVILKGLKTISTTAGTTTKNVTLNLTMYFNEKRGKDGDIFKISQISVTDE